MRVLLSQLGSRLCALPLEHVSEVMRALPVEPLANLPEQVLGMAIVRGVPAPVIDAGLLLGDSPSAKGRFIALKIAGRCALLAVDDAIGVRTLPDLAPEELAPLLQQAQVERMAALDEQLLLVLRTAALVPEEAFAAVERLT